MVDGPAVVMAKAIWKKANRPSPKPVECIFLLLFLVLYIFIFPQTDELTLNSKKQNTIDFFNFLKDDTIPRR